MPKTRRGSLKDIVIEPWEEPVDGNGIFIPEYVEELAKEVIKNYDLRVQSYQAVATKPEQGGAIWKIETNLGPKSFKLLHRRPSRSLFSIDAQKYLVEVKHARVPAIFKTRNGQDYIETGGKLWFVADWIEPLEPVSKDLEGTKQLCYALGEFHRLTQGYVPSTKTEIASRLYKWPKKYGKMITRMEWFRIIAETYNEMPASSHILAVVDKFQEQARNSLKRLSDSDYFELIKKGNEAWGLAHQDYGWSNGQMGPNGIWTIDLDGVAYDLPIRDLRKLISGKMQDLYKWDVTWVREMIKAYHEANPITPEVYEILMIDLSLPNEFYRYMSDVLYEPDLLLNDITAIKSIVDIDQSKWNTLKEIQSDWRK
jgi:CotS family spore coat protein